MLPYFYQKEINTNLKNFNLSEETSKHCIQVLRMPQGAQLQLTNGEGLTTVVEIITAHKKNTLVKIISQKHFEKKVQQNVIAISLVKNASRLEWFLEKATELGIYKIVPLICKRTERQVFKEERLQNIVISAMLQSQQNFLPILEKPQNFETYLKTNLSNKKFIAHCINTDKNNFHSLLTKTANQTILIGPEGDFTNEEIALAINNNYVPVSLGNTRLRTETAGVAAAVLMQIN